MLTNALTNQQFRETYLKQFLIIKTYQIIRNHMQFCKKHVNGFCFVTTNLRDFCNVSKRSHTFKAIKTINYLLISINNLRIVIKDALYSLFGIEIDNICATQFISTNMIIDQI